MSVVGLHRVRVMRLLFATWLAVVATLTPLLMPTAGIGAAGATAGIGDPFASELCSVTHATGNDSGDGQTPAHDPHRHCPICRTVQQLAACDVPASQVAVAVASSSIDIVARSMDVVRSFHFNSPVQPRAPPVRV